MRIKTRSEKVAASKNSIDKAVRQFQALEGGPDTMDVDAHLEKVADSYGRMPDGRYIKTITHRGPQTFYFFHDKATPHDSNFVMQDGDRVLLFMAGNEPTAKGNKNGLRQYVITEGEHGETNVADMGFSPREDWGLAVAIPEYGYVKEFSSEGGITGENNPDIAWLERIGMLTAAQQAEMDLVGFSLRAVQENFGPTHPLQAA